MKLTYETGIATMIQFITLSLLNIATGTHSVVVGCTEDGSNCASDILVSMIFFILICGWLGFVWLLGMTAQTRRSKFLARLLILAELAIVAVALFNLKHHNDGDVLSLVTSAVDLVLAIWIITLAFRLMRSKGGRVVAKQRPRQRQRQRTVSKL